MKLFGETHRQIVGITFVMFIVGIGLFLLASHFHLGNLLEQISFYLLIIGAFGMIGLTCGVVMILGVASMIFPHQIKGIEDEC